MGIAPKFHECSADARIERRRFQRFQIAVQVEFSAKGSGVPIRTETTDIGEGGCYVQMPLTLEVGTQLSMTLWLGHEKLLVEGTVVTCHPQFGNGIEFVGLSSDSRQQLRRFLETP